MLLGGYNPLMNSSIALCTTIATSANGIVNSFWRFVDAVELGNLLFGGFIEGKIFVIHHSFSFTV